MGAEVTFLKLKSIFTSRHGDYDQDYDRDYDRDYDHETRGFLTLDSINYCKPKYFSVQNIIAFCSNQQYF